MFPMGSWALSEVITNFSRAHSYLPTGFVTHLLKASSPPTDHALVNTVSIPAVMDIMAGQQFHEKAVQNQNVGRDPQETIGSNICLLLRKLKMECAQPYLILFINLLIWERVCFVFSLFYIKDALEPGCQKSFAATFVPHRWGNWGL